MDIIERAVLICVTAALLFLFSPALNRLDLAVFDLFSSWSASSSGLNTPDRDAINDIVLVIIDDESILSIPGLFHGNRSVFAQAITYINSGQPKAIGLDVFFPSGSVDNPLQDRELINAVAATGKTVLRSYQRDDRRITPPFPELARSGIPAPVFFGNFRDGLTRSTVLAFKSQSGDITPSFQLELLRLFSGGNSSSISFSDNKVNIAGQNVNYSAPLFDGQKAIINYAQSMHGFKTISFSSIFNQKILTEIFKDKLVLIGYANSMTEEKYQTPLNSSAFSPHLNALVILNLMQNRLIQPPHPYQGTLIALLLLALFVLFVYPGVNLATALLLVGIVSLSTLLFSYQSFLHYSRLFDIAPVFTALFLSFFAVAGRKYMHIHKEKSRIKNAFQHYVTASVVNEILKNPEKLNLHGEERNLTIFFSDIEGFTTLSEGMSPLDVVSLLNEYLSEMTEIIFKFDGLLDKYEGDAIMSVFGAPVDQRDHAIRACLCALENQKALKALREKWKAEGKPEIRARIGINTGLVVVGNMGSKMRFDYTVIGDNVNLAARLETANKVTATDILISEETAMLAESAIISRCLGKLKVAGKVNLVRVFEVLASRKEKEQTLLKKAEAFKSAYESAAELVSKRNFKAAEEVLQEHLNAYPEDKPARILMNKAKGFLIVPPPPSWENIITQENK